MKKLSFKNISIVSLSLLGVSAVVSAFTRSTEGDENNAAFAQGIAQLSSGGSLFTAVPGVGVASYTQTGIGSDTGAGALTTFTPAWNNTGHDTTRNG